MAPTATLCTHFIEWSSCPILLVKVDVKRAFFSFSFFSFSFLLDEESSPQWFFWLRDCGFAQEITVITQPGYTCHRHGAAGLVTQCTVGWRWAGGSTLNFKSQEASPHQVSEQWEHFPPNLKHNEIQQMIRKWKESIRNEQVWCRWVPGPLGS